MAPDGFDAWTVQPDFVDRLSARMPYVYRPGSGGGWGPTAEALPDVLGWPASWEARVEEAPSRADARYRDCTFLDVRGRDPQHPGDELGVTIAVSNRAGR